MTCRHTLQSHLPAADHLALSPASPPLLFSCGHCTTTHRPNEKDISTLAYVAYCVNKLLSSTLRKGLVKEGMCRGGGVQADLPGSSTNMESVSPYTTRAFHLSLASTMRMAFSRVSLADCSTTENTYDGISHTSHTCVCHVFVASSHTVLTARVYWRFPIVHRVSIIQTEGLLHLTAALSTLHGQIAAKLPQWGQNSKLC